MALGGKPKERTVNTTAPSTPSVCSQFFQSQKVAEDVGWQSGETISRYIPEAVSSKRHQESKRKVVFNVLEALQEVDRSTSIPLDRHRRVRRNAVSVNVFFLH